ncbi:hypothetical protein DUNSADRAFT_12173 [Dunaliella salina]|uniref:Uncharacterized protein n=1 Tax=Dunaliella salina TaxID=3046 RepID=A0ABQ7GBU6_DUNSA|nr:hypothetical protein DUNSADRAFT_12173 [Dunaliella salina]|eukprot:KAF5832083.1 hypothetical protein DUNSADRAFT_12173 [Dunaliella salina]
MSVTELRSFLELAGAGDELRACREKAEMLAAAKTRANAWEVRRVLTAKKVFPHEPAFMAALLRCDPAQIQVWKQRACVVSDLSTCYATLFCCDSAAVHMKIGGELQRLLCCVAVVHMNIGGHAAAASFLQWFRWRSVVKVWLQQRLSVVSLGL